MKCLILVATLMLLPIFNAAADAPAKQAPLSNGMIKVAFVVSNDATVIDIAGPWEVFADTSVKNASGKDIAPYELYTVASSKTPIHTSGSNHPGITITPDYEFADASVPDIVVVGAQSGGPGLNAWLKKIHAEHKTIMSVCTGAFLLAKTGLLNGKQATTHHWFFGNFAREFPDVKLVKEVRYVQASPTIFTSGGETSGIDLALHLVSDRFGQEVAQETADFMEYQGAGWKTNRGISVATTPVTYQDWSGQVAPDTTVVLHAVIRGASPTFTTDIPAWKVTGAPTTVKQKGKQAVFTFQIADRPVTFTGQVAGKGSNTKITGTLVRDDKSYPLTLTQQPHANVSKTEHIGSNQ